MKVLKEKFLIDQNYMYYILVCELYYKSRVSALLESNKP